MNGETKEGIFTKPRTRREFLKTMVKAGGVLLGGSIGITSCLPVPKEQEKVQPPLAATPAEATATSLPKQEQVKKPVFLTEEELQKAHIKIYQTSEVTLKVEKGIFDLPVFKDAADGKLKEVVVVLVDHPQMSWNASKKLPDDARLVWQAINIHPSEYPDEYWEKRQEYTKNMVKLLKERLQIIQKQADLNTNPDLKYFYEGLISREKISSSNYEQSLFFLNKGREDAVGIAEEMGIAWPDGEIYGQIIRPDTDYDYFPTPSIQKRFQDFPETAKRFQDLKKEHPELYGRVFIYLVVGGVQKPRPTQSYPKPEQFIERKDLSGGDNRYKYYIESAGPVLRHELGHYVTGSQSVDEYEADTKMFESIEGARNKKQKGDDSGYPFHFFTEEGETITKRQESIGRQAA